MRSLARDDGDPDQRPPMQVEMPRLGDRNLKRAPHLSNDGPHDRPLFLERLHIPEDEIDLKRPNPHAFRLRPGLLFHFERLDHVVDLDVVERAEPDTALVPFADLSSVVLETLERFDLEMVVDDHTVANQAGLGVSGDHARANETAGDVAELARAEDVANLGSAKTH